MSTSNLIGANGILAFPPPSLTVSLFHHKQNESGLFLENSILPTSNIFLSKLALLMIVVKTAVFYGDSGGGGGGGDFWHKVYLISNQFFFVLVNLKDLAFKLK